MFGNITAKGKPGQKSLTNKEQKNEFNLPMPGRRRNRNHS